MTKARECEDAVDEMESTASQMRCNAVSAPMVRSVIDMSLLSLSDFNKHHLLDRTDETNDVEVLECVELIVVDLTIAVQLFDQTWPLLAKSVSSCQ